ncbi:MAG: MBL fold metallo-hydrolase [candidate division WOR-3 bacterium]
MKIQIKKFVVGPLATNCYIAYDIDTNEAVIVDPGFPDQRIIDYLIREKLRLTGIILTHGHFDHIMGLGYLTKFCKTSVFIHKHDEPLLRDPHKNHSIYLGEPFTFIGEVELINSDEVIKSGSLELKIIETPGHTRGSISILLDKFLFSGDTLFVDAIGRTDFPESAPERMEESINRLLNIGSDIILHPGHMGSGKIRAPW